MKAQRLTLFFMSQRSNQGVEPKVIMGVSVSRKVGSLAWGQKKQALTSSRETINHKPYYLSFSDEPVRKLIFGFENCVLGLLEMGLT